MINFGRNLLFILLLSISVTAGAVTKNEDISTMNRARDLYAKGKLQDALDTYKKISKSSDFWVEAIEEKAWTYVRLNDFDSALSELKSILNPLFLPFVGPETIMLATFIDLKTCNYKGVFEKIKLYKDEMLPRVDSLEAIRNGTETKVVDAWTARMRQGLVTSAMVGKDVTKLPRYFYRDKLVVNSKNRAKELAGKDLEDISKNLKKMKIIEIEVIQRSFAYDDSVSKDKLKFKNTKDKDVMKFPYDKNSKEVWLDEIGNFEVKTQVCANTKGVKK